MTISSQVLIQSSLPLGPQGVQGVQGTQGIQGIQGLQGTQGTQGTQGIQGVQGLLGLQGLQGTQGTQGLQGTQGTQGIQGDQGIQGIQGIQGLQGTQGAQGVQGILGNQGIQGSQGVQGEQGVQGVQGIQGNDAQMQGTQGLQGTQGTQGIQGDQGIQGIQGLQGITSDQILNTTSNVTFASVTTPFIRLNANMIEKFSTISSATGVVIHDCTNGALFNHVSIANTFTVNVTNLGLDPGYATNIVLILNQESSAYVPTAIQISGVSRPIFWQGGVAPFGNALKRDIVSFSVLNSSGMYVVYGQLVSFG